MTRSHTYHQKIHNPHSGGASVSALHREKCRAVVTVEAALVLPFFLFAALCLIYLLEIMAVETSIKAGMHNAGRIAAEELYLLPVVNASRVQSDIVNTIGSARLDQSIIEGGSSGLQCHKSYATPSGEIYLTVEYEVRIPFPYFTIPVISKSEHLHTKGWTGYEKSSVNLDGATIVYMTIDGSVYHKDYHCTYLQLSIHMVPSGSVWQLRNEDGERYHACEICVGNTINSGVFITDTGNRYHNVIGCSGLKRTVYALPLAAAGGRGACSRCGQ